MDKETTKADGLLVTTSIIWGFAFVAQRVGMDFVGPFLFNGLRFALGSLSLIPLILYRRTGQTGIERQRSGSSAETILIGGVLTGTALFAGASLQQVGLVYTTAGKAGFITGLYVVIVPMMGIFIGQRTGIGTWIGVFLAAAGLYLLTITEAFTISYGDLLEVMGAFFWAGHLLLIARFSRKIDPVVLSFVQFAACALLSLTTAFCIESISWRSIVDAAVPILYGGLCSVGIAYTLQVVAQRRAHPAHAAIILSLESVFAAVGGWILLGETLSVRALIGCALMFAAMVFTQLSTLVFRRKP
ncbi:MAG: DMT family transporter [Proteobacteria bacterium]|nr:DMT family transporter [Pseudomonadota bacterium]